MSKVNLDKSVLEKLCGFHAPVAVVDEAGNVMGHFVPELEEGMEPMISAEEIQRRIQAGGGRKLADILADLEKRP